MNLLDTDVLSHLQKADTVGVAIAVAMSASTDQDFRITTINAYEMLDGAFSLIEDLRKKHKALIPGLRLFQDLLDYLSPWQGLILHYDDATERIYRSFAPVCVRSSRTTRGSRRLRDARRSSLDVQRG